MMTTKVQDTGEAFHVLKKADKTWVVHQIVEFLDDEHQINRIRTDLSSHMYGKH